MLPTAMLHKLAPDLSIIVGKTATYVYDSVGIKETPDALSFIVLCHLHEAT